MTNAEKSTDFRYLEFLKYIKKGIEENPYFSLFNAAAKIQVSKNVSTHLQSGGILKKHGKVGLCRWEWITPIEPNIKMAHELRIRCCAQSFEKKKIRLAEAKTICDFQKSNYDVHPIRQIEKQIENKNSFIPYKKKKKVSFLWGAFTIEF